MKRMTGILLLAISISTTVQAQEFKWQEGEPLAGFDNSKVTVADRAAALKANLPPTYESASLPNSDLTLDTGYFETAPVAAPGAFDRSFTGLRFRFSIEGH